MRKLIMAFAVTALWAAPAFSQTQTPAGQTKSMADCESNFKAADKDGNGMLSKAEMTETPKVIPTAASSQESLSKAQFMSACEGTNPKGG